MNITNKKASDHKNDSILKLVVISDMHAWDEENKKEVGSWLKMGQPENIPNQHPIIGLLDLIKKEDIKADYLLCCGDLADKANPKALIYAWEQVVKLKKAISAKQVFATSGNHDVDSRYKYNDYDAKGTLQSLVPLFPIEIEPLNDKYWAKNYVIIDNHNCRFVILNSSAYHGQVSNKTPPEYLHGRVSKRTILSLEQDLKLKETSEIVNILLCHHHPHKHNDIELDDYSEMKEGSRLLELLGCGKYGRWVIIHGHKHHPRLCYAAGGSSAPIIFSAGSLCAKLYSEQQAHARNQFYVIEFPYGNFSNLGLEIAGRFKSWDWIPGDGWQVADNRSGLPGLGGFGYRTEISIVAERIYELLVQNDKPFCEWEYILGKIPQLDFLFPKDKNLLVETLQNKHQLEILTSTIGSIKQIGKGKKNI